MQGTYKTTKQLKQEREESTMTKAEKDIYNFTKRHMKENNISPFGASIFHYIGGAFPKAKMEKCIECCQSVKGR